MRYEICVEGGLGGQWSGWFDGMEITHELDGVTVIVGEVADQAALHGVLAKVRDLGLVLISVNRVDPHPHRFATASEVVGVEQDNGWLNLQSRPSGNCGIYTDSVEAFHDPFSERPAGTWR